ncbi:helix-turn-helix protein [Pseudorhodoferax soli]|uniref:Helix-turn-helix protein n=1 Tax=Pseudorhodoferax soli TaxID=545864 RepID=A0A368XZD6_9BURK|nr:helix-turn-helix protein [Pseudorhodoferax soli]
MADLLQIAGLARSTFYYQCHATERADRQSAMQARIRTVYDEHKGRYGYRRITAVLCNPMEEPVNHKCVQRLMQKMGLLALIRAKKRSPHVPGMSDAHVPNVLKRDFCATAPNQKWATDVTEFNVNGHKLYLSACMDLYNGEIVAYRMARRPVFAGLQHARGSAFADQVRRRTDRALGPSLALQDAAVPGDARETWSQAKHEPQGQLL